MNKVVLITGGSSGIGLAAARAFAEQGCVVYEISRRYAETKGVFHIQADITCQEQINAAIETVKKEQGRIDVLVNNAGFGISGAVEFIPHEAAARQMQVNFLGCDSVCRAVIPLMRENGGGRIINLSSVAAVVPIPFQAHYSASKAAINAFTLALANEVKPFGIQVCAIMPGDINTGFTAARKKACDGDRVYNGRISRSVSKMEHDEQKGMSAEKAGKAIAKLALRKRCKPLTALSANYKLVCLLFKILPCRLANSIIKALYAN